MKKFISPFICFILLFSLSGCYTVAWQPGEELPVREEVSFNNSNFYNVNDFGVFGYYYNSAWWLNEDYDFLETLPIEKESGLGSSPHEQLEQSQLIDIIEKSIETLPARQREAFLLRYWEEMDVTETAGVMGCSEGSVKTHCSRAVHALAAILKKNGIEL